MTNRLASQLREVELIPNFVKHAEGSVLVAFGDTKVICTASVQDSVPPFLEGLGKGWLTAEYAMLPRSTHTRKKRERNKIDGRSSEIQRLIGRSLRAIVDMNRLGERTIMIDCDVLQADGGTRTAAITGSYVALYQALKHLQKNGDLDELPLIDSVAAISVGILDNTVYLDLDYKLDSNADVDMNVVMTGSGKIIEMQGTAEKDAFTKEQLDAMYELAAKGIKELTHFQQNTIEKL